MIFDNHSKPKIENILDQISSLIAQGYDKDYSTKQLKAFKIKKDDFEEFWEIAKARIKGKEKFRDTNKMFMSLNDLRFATPDFIADYRAKRLKGNIIVDLCSGIGSQTIAFAKICKKVISVEINPRKVEYAKKNAALYGLGNIEFICGDAVSEETIKKIAAAKADIIFCDPERLASEEERKIETVKFLPEIIKKYSKIGKSLAIEVPPQLAPDKIGFDCEKEYLSVKGELNRLTLYFGSCKKCERSVAAISADTSSEERICSSENKLALEKSGKALKYIYDVDKAVLKSGLLEELYFKLGSEFFIFKMTKKNLFLTSDQKINSAFLQGFAVLEEVAGEWSQAEKALERLEAKKVILRGEIDQKDYWGIREALEEKLSGTEIIYLFILEGSFLICKKFDKD